MASSFSEAACASIAYLSVTNASSNAVAQQPATAHSTELAWHRNFAEGGGGLGLGGIGGLGGRGLGLGGCGGLGLGGGRGLGLGGGGLGLGRDGGRSGCGVLGLGGGEGDSKLGGGRGGGGTVQSLPDQPLVHVQV